MADGWIKLHRKVLENPVACKDSDHLAVWNYLLLNATHKEFPVLFCGRQVTLKPGQLITGRKSIASKFKISESKVERILKRFEIEQQIEQHTGNTSRLISVRSWEEYQTTEQPSEQQVNNDRTTSEQRPDTNKNVKNVKNIRRVAPPAPQKSIDERLKDFKLSLVPFLETYGQETIKTFCNYWTEKNPSGKKMRFEMEKTFEASKRLVTWKRKGDEFNRNKPIKQQINPGKVQ